MQTDPNSPYISVVIAARNDNHGGDMLVRMQAFADSWIGLSKRYALPSEIVVVEWNPPQGRPPLKEALRWPPDIAPCAVRFVQVSPELHHSFEHGSAIALHQMIAKNVGIRRARGEFVLCTNLDIIFSDELMQYLGRRPLDPGAFYRMDRYDVAREIPAEAGLDELLAFCKTHIRRVAAREGTFETNGDGVRPIDAEDIIDPGSGIRLGRGWYTSERYPTSPILRYVEPTAEIVFERPAGANRISLEVEIGPSARDGHVVWEVADESGDTAATVDVTGSDRLELSIPEDLQAGRFTLRVQNGGAALMQEPRMLDIRVLRIKWVEGTKSSGWKFEGVERSPAIDRTGNCPARSPYAAHMRSPAYLHTNACGDFTLLSRKTWFALRGYPEFPIWPTHLDALLCYAAYHAGLREVILQDPMRVFHVQHQTIWTPETEEEIIARATVRGIPILAYQTMVKHVHYMRRFSVPLLYTGEKWGLGGVELPEHTV